jgi:hypothetical protein
LLAYSQQLHRSSLSSGYFSPMTVAEIKTLPAAQKLQIMEMIWDNMKERFEASEISPEVRSLLDERRARVERGESKLLDWDVVKSSLQRS